MQIVLLASKEQIASKPLYVSVIKTWGEITVDIDGTPVTGTQIAFDGPEKAIVDWLKPFGTVWMGTNIIADRKFELVRIK